MASRGQPNARWFLGTNRLRSHSLLPAKRLSQRVQFDDLTVPPTLGTNGLAMPATTGSPLKKCFVISPIGDPGSPLRTLADHLLGELIQPALALEGFDANRLDQLRASWIDAQLVAELQDSDLVAAVLTEPSPGQTNANVYWELGIANTLCKAVVPIAAKGTHLPFDVAQLNVIHYRPDPHTGLVDVAHLTDAVDRLRAHVRGMDMEVRHSPFRSVLRAISGRYALSAIYEGKMWVLDLFRKDIWETQREMKRDNKLNKVFRAPDPTALVRIGQTLKRHATSYLDLCTGLHQVVRVANLTQVSREHGLDLCGPMIELGDRAVRLADWLEESAQNLSLREADIEETAIEVGVLLTEIDGVRSDVAKRRDGL